MTLGILLPLLFLVLFTGVGVNATSRRLLSESNRKYQIRDDVPLYANKVGPFNNPSETYQYYDLPFCLPKKLKPKIEDLGEVIEGDRMVNTPYDVRFAVNKTGEKLCREKILSVEDVRKFRKAVQEDYYFQMFYDDLPIWGYIGTKEPVGEAGKDEVRYLLFTHIRFDVKYNNDRVIEISVTADRQETVDITEDKQVNVEFSFSTMWTEVSTPYEKRREKYDKISIQPKHLEIHWFSIINSCVTVLLLTGFLATILMRVLKNDFIKYTREDESAEEQEETGWKYIHGDVFRFPPYPIWFCAMIGAGTQLLVLVLLVFGLALLGLFYHYNRGNIYTACIVLYALTAGISGYVSAHLHRQMGGDNWVRNVILTALIFCGPFCAIFALNNTVAIVYGSTMALPFNTIVIIILMWILSFLLTILGAIAGKKNKTDFYAPCRTNKYPREIPALPWYRKALPQMFMAGFLPFSAIYIELYYIFASVWGHKIYTIYSILFIVFIILIIVTAFITIALTYFQLAIEDHEWWWRSFLCGGSTGLFIYGYCLYYYWARSDMTGFMQTSFFFGYMACICYGFFLMLGSVGYRASLLFVRHIYRAIKCE